MKILFCIPEPYGGNRWGGVTTYTLTLATALQALGNEVHVVTPGDKDQVFTYSEVVIHTLSHRRVQYPFYFRLFIKIIQRASGSIADRLSWAFDVSVFVKSKAFNIVEAPEWGSSTLFISSNSTRSIVVRLHRSWMQYLKDNMLPMLFSYRIIDMFERWCVLKARAVTAPTQFMIYEYPFIYRLRHVVLKPMVEIPNGVITKSNQIKKTTRDYLLTVGRIEIGKGSVLLAKAFIQINKKYPRLKLIYIGEDTTMFFKSVWQSCKQYIQKILKDNNLKNQVQFIPKQSQMQLASYYRNCLLYVAPSRGHENPSMSLLEALSYGKAVVASNAGGIPEVVLDSVNGLLFQEDNVVDLTEKLTKMIERSVLRRRSEKNNSQNRFDINKSAELTIQLYTLL